MSLAPLEALSYVEVRPAENPEGVAAKAKALALGTDSKEAVDKRMEAMAPGDERSVALSNYFQFLGRCIKCTKDCLLVSYL